MLGAPGPSERSATQTKRTIRTPSGANVPYIHRPEADEFAPLRVANVPYIHRPEADELAHFGVRKSETPLNSGVSGGPGRSRTFDRRIKSPLLYQLSYEPDGCASSTRSTR